MSNANAFLIVVVIVAFVAGYSIVSFVVKKLRQNLGIRGDGQRGRPGPNATMSEQQWPDDHLSGGNRGSTEREPSSRRDHVAPHESGQRPLSGSEDRRYANILGLGPDASAEDVTEAYGRLIAKYEPERIHRLDEEVRRIAEIRRQEIVDAYDYFRRKYDSG